MKQKIEQHVAQVLHGKTAGRVERLLQSKIGLWLIAAISFFESALPVPLITDPFMVAGILANRTRAWQIILITIITSILGGLAAFSMAAFFFDVLTTYMTSAMQVEFQSMIEFGASETFVTTLTGAVTPIPYTITAWVVAAAGGSFWLFLGASLIGRSFRYITVGYCTYKFGPSALQYARRSLAISSFAILVFVGLYIWLKL